ncbi:CRISPR-associated helicase/endonuclease Cas3 [Streptomyces sp. AC1-42W]|uniref:CRISPR-associated helicase Cas3' n=1 Tax=unclassified Streptomyces TaxID=2593676 RepID=UPI000DABBCF2|nr:MULTISPECIES: CRISPR-associated helicase Cas3' [unclassified Streptomyces]PZT78000.1 CRISPR-associated helicase/endonuclease Cas3 [Streptomyces sp. AC1-42W]PZT80622.1 CRISPR-associated helicase/endonuclease Cas3 [Streptomyces sp. AC1-42T]
MEDSAAVAGLLWDSWLPGSVRAVVSASLPGGEDDGRRLAVWLAGAHDIGKATPAFACQVEQLAARMRDAGLEMRSAKALGPDRRIAPHGLAGQALLGEWLRERHGWTKTQAGQFTVVVGGHHGVPPERGQITALSGHGHLLRTPGPSRDAWQRVQGELLDACADEYRVRDRLDAWRDVRLPQTAQVLLTSLVIVADWIASNADLFPYFPQDVARSGEERVAAAWRGLDLPAPWSPPDPTEDAQQLIGTRFGLPEGAKARPVQEAAVELARAMERPGLMVIEAPMGEGKTEAALAVTEIFAARSGAGGVFFALPTMATGNAMFPRLLEWIKRLPSTRDAEHSVLLAHSKAALNERFADLMRDSGQRIAAVDLDAQEVRRVAPAGLVAHAWLRGRKKAMLASFVAGTIDQLLFAGLKSRHLAMRHLAVAGKVVVIDEAHAYDTYMSVYLDRVLSWLGAYGVPVVILSATLPARRRRELVEAYAGTTGTPEAFEGVAEATAYPLLTAVTHNGSPVMRGPGASGRGTDVVLEPFDDDTDAVVGRLAHELDGGGCALVVRNTVARVLETAKALRARFGDENVTVAHSRFIDVDRAAKDADLLKRFGPPGTAQGRPPGPHIVVASQVAEQSLDVDFDLLVTDLCPVDLLLQRMGRLHRHQRGEGQRDRPERLRRARCLVTGADWQPEVPVPVRGSVAVYGAYTLLRSAAVLLPHFEQGEERPVRLPDDICPLVQGAYADDTEAPAGWTDAMADALERHEDHLADQAERAAVFRLGKVGTAGRPLFGWVAAGVGDTDDSPAGRAQVRDTRDGLEVLVVRRRADGSLTTVPWLAPDRNGKPLGGLELPLDQLPPRRTARAAASCGLRLPTQFSYGDVMDRAISELEQLWVPAWQVKESSWLAGQLILVLDEDCQTHLAGFSLSYSQCDGLEVTRD